MTMKTIAMELTTMKTEKLSTMETEMTKRATTLHWCTGTIKKVFGNKRNEALVLWEAIPKFDYPEQQSVEEFPPHKFKSKKCGGWILYKEVDYGL
jgi:hypothetical protein